MMKEVNVKLVLLGDANVGKSSIIVTYIDHKFSEFLPSTLGIAYVNKMIN